MRRTNGESIKRKRTQSLTLQSAPKRTVRIESRMPRQKRYACTHGPFRHHHPSGLIPSSPVPLRSTLGDRCRAPTSATRRRAKARREKEKANVYSESKLERIFTISNCLLTFRKSFAENSAIYCTKSREI